MRTRIIALLAAGALAIGGYAVGSASGAHRLGGASTALPGFSSVVSLSHTNAPAKTPLFPGDPAFRLTTFNTIPVDGYTSSTCVKGSTRGRTTAHRAISGKARRARRIWTRPTSCSRRS